MKLRIFYTTVVLFWASVGMVNGQCLVIQCPLDTTLQSGPNCDRTVNYTRPAGIDICNPNIAYTFTSCGATGRLGPSQSQANTAYGSTNLNGLVTVNGGIQYWVVPLTTTYTIEARGAQGAGPQGGKGARIQGDFALNAGDTIAVLVGQKGATYSSDVNIGGGGGSYVIKKNNGNTILVIAGGGGAARSPRPNTHGTNSQSGQGGYVNGTTAQGAGGTSGAGGGGASCRGGGGAGWLTSGAVGGCGGAAGQGGITFVLGGLGGNIASTGAVGGFGGGGSSEGTNTTWTYCGGGGGYSGGGGASQGDTSAKAGGGGSYNSGNNKVDSAGVNLNDGIVKIIRPGTIVTTSLTSGMGTGSAFLLGVSTESYSATDGTNTVNCSFKVTVVDTPMTSIDPFSADSICVFKGSIALPAANPPGGTFTGSGVSGTDFDPTISGAGIYWITYTDTIGCPKSDSAQITVVDGPPAKINAFSKNTICNTEPPIPLPAGSPLGGNYIGSGVSGFNFNPATAGLGTVWIYYENTNACPSLDSTSITVEICGGIAGSNAAEAIEVIPNPANGKYYLTGNLNVLQAIRVYSATGKLVYENSRLVLDNAIDITDQPDGIYLIMLDNGSEVDSRRVVKK